MSKYPINGFAPGGYTCTCRDCGKNFIGDKRAWQCEPCALLAGVELKEDYIHVSAVYFDEGSKRMIETVFDTLKKYDIKKGDLIQIDVTKPNDSVPRYLLGTHKAIVTSVEECE